MISSFYIYYLVVLHLIPLCSSENTFLSSILDAENKCLIVPNKSYHFKNRLINYQNKSRFQYIRGNSYWLNEFLAVGHLMYDIQLLEFLQTGLIHRIVLPRAHCATKDLCEGKGTFKTFFEGYFKVALKLSNLNIPIYYRGNQEDAFWTSLELNQNNMTNKFENLNLKIDEYICFEKGFIVLFLSLHIFFFNDLSFVFVKYIFVNVKIVFVGR